MCLAYQKEDWIQLDYYFQVSTSLKLVEGKIPNCNKHFKMFNYTCKQIVENWGRHINILQNYLTANDELVE